MKIPDYISPVVGYRVWRWKETGLQSLNGEPWLPGQQLEARCRVAPAARHVEEALNEVPHRKCTCGIYAAKNSEHLRQIGYADGGICGEVYLWGTVVEHKLGWRAQYAYPKTFALAPSLFPFSLATVEARLRPLTEFGTDIFILHDHQRIVLWKKGSGYDAIGLDCLIANRETYYVRRLHELTIKQGERVAILGRGIGVVKNTNPTEVTVVLGKSSPLHVPRKEIVRDQQNNRWEWNPQSA